MPAMLKRNSLTVFIIGLLLFGGFALTSLFSFFSARNSLRHQIADSQLPLISDNIYSEIQRDMLAPIFISSFMASDTFLRDWVLQGEKDVERMTRYLREVKNRYRTITSFFISDKSRIYYHFNGILKTVSPDDPLDEWYFRVRDMPDLYEINVDPDMANKDTMTIFINYRVFDYNNTCIGATGIGLTVNAVTSRIEQYQRVYGRQIYFVDGNGTIRLHGRGFHSPNRQLQQVDGVGEIADKILTSDTGSFRVERNGSIVFLNTRFIPEFGWFLIVEQEEGPVLQNIAKALATNLFICLLVSLLVLWLAAARLSSYHRRIEHMAITDNLTQTYNRHAFSAIYKQILKQSQRDNTFFSVLLLDIDYFKRINDRYGHHVGDQVIQEVVEHLQNTLRVSDPIFRWGGEEFLVLLKDCSLQDACITGEKILEAIRTHTFVTGKDQVHITASIGAAEFVDGENPDTLIARADSALYQAKKEGRDCLRWAAETSDSAVN